MMHNALHVDAVFTPLSKDKESKENDVLLYDKLSDPVMKLKLIKQRDKYKSFAATADYEKQFDTMMIKLLGDKKDPTLIRNIYILSPTFKSLSIYKMLYNIVNIQGSGCASQWSGFNVEFLERIKSIDIKQFFRYLWCEQLLGGSKVISCRLHKYVKGILSNLNCFAYHDETMTEKIADHIKSRFRLDLNGILSTSIESFVSKFNLNEQFERLFQWDMILGIVPLISKRKTDLSPLKKIRKEQMCFKTETIKGLLTINNTIPSLSEVAVILNGSKIECWHLPSETCITFTGDTKLRVENSELCFGSKGESLYYAELKVKNLSEKHFTDQGFQRYVLMETSKTDKICNTDSRISETAEKNPLFDTLTKAQTSLTDATNPLSSTSLIRDRANNMREYVSRVNSDMNELEYKMSIFLEKLSPSSSDTFVDDMVQRGMQNYFKKIKPEIDESERTIRDSLDKFRMYVVKQLNVLPKGLYEFQERMSDLHFENEMNLDDFIEELSSTEKSKMCKVPNISSLQDIDKTAVDLKQMQEQVTQYCELALKFMNFLKKAQTVILNLKADDSVKDLQIETLTQHNKEIVRLASKYREAANKQVDVYKDKLRDVNKELDKFLNFQDKYMSKTKQTFLSIRDSLMTNTGQWVNKDKQKQDKKEDRLRFLEETFSKQYDSTCNHLERPSSFDIEFIKVDGLIKKDNLDRRIDDTTLEMYVQSLKQYWKNILNNTIPIEETVTKNGVRLYNVNEKQMCQTFIASFFRILYNNDIFLIRCKDLPEYTQTYGIDLGVEITVKQMLRCKEGNAQVFKRTDGYTETNDNLDENQKGLLFEK